MTGENPQTLAQKLFQIFKRISRVQLEQTPFHGLKPSEGKLLGRLYFNLNHGKNNMRASDLSKLLGITPAGVTHLINPLEESGYIKRLPDPSDRRVVLIGLTEQGKETAQVLISDVNQKLSGLIEYLGEEDSKTFIRLMSTSIEYLESL